MIQGHLHLPLIDLVLQLHELNVHVFIFTLFLAVKTKQRELDVLLSLIYYGPLSAYKLAQKVNMPFATAWRFLTKLSKEGHVRKVGKNFEIAPRGLVLLFKESREESVKLLASHKLKETWGYEGDVTDIYDLLEDISSRISDKIKIENLCLEHPEALAGFLYPFSERLSEGGKRVVAYFLLKVFPTVQLTQSCRAVLLIDEKGGVRTVALKCAKHGLKLNHNCEELESLEPILANRTAKGS